ncbi:hypothetical protein D3C85_1668300 [compost metagenome]
MTTSKAAKNLTMNSSTDALMFTDWSVTLVRLRPRGSPALIARASTSSDLPRSSPFHPSRMTTPISKAGSPPLRIMKVAGSS